MNYALGLSIKWTDKEWAKIKEIKSRQNRWSQHKDAMIVPWEGWKKPGLSLKDVRRIEIKRNRIKAINLLYDANYPIIKIADMFEMTEQEINRIVRNHSMGRGYE